MTAFDYVLIVSLRFLCLLANAMTANIVVTAGGHKNMIEITQTDWAVVFKHLALLARLLSPSSRILVLALNLLFAVFGDDSDFVSLF